MSSGTKNGERFSWIGETFFNQCKDLIKELEGNILSSKYEGKDFVVEFKKNFLFCPEGKYVIEVTTSNIREEELKEIEDKMKKENISFGLWITNCKICDETINKAKGKKIFIWDIRTICLLTAIQDLKSFWCTGTKIFLTVKDGLFLIRSIENTKKDYFINAVILSTETTKDFLIKDAKEAIKCLFDNIKQAGINPINVNMVLLSNGLINNAVYTEIDQITEKFNQNFSSEGIYGDIVGIIDFYTSPASYNLLFSSLREE